MDYVKLQGELLKKGLAGFDEVNDETVALINKEGTCAYFMPKKDCLLNLDKLPRFNGTAGVIDDEATALANTNELVSLNKRVYIKVLLTDADSTQVLIDEKLLKTFGKYDLLKGTSPTQPVQVYNKGVLLGIVCPFRCKA